MMERYTEFEKLNDTPEIKFEKPSAEDRARFEAFLRKARTLSFRAIS